ncbi:D-isomer specific 2-hydroxyacid dehydrogenase family protein [Kineococcus sp. NUM-3379]
MTSAAPDLAVHVGGQEHPGLAAAVERAGARVVPLEEADALVWVGGPDGFPDPLPASVRWVQLSSAGVESWFDSGLLDPARTWTSAGGAYAEAVADHAVALLLAGVRQFPAALATQTWDPSVAEATTSLRGTTVAVVGAGGIGRAMIGPLRALGADVLAVTRRGHPVEGAVDTLPAERTGEVWDRADHVVLAAPATAETTALVGEEELARLGKHGWLVNIARGSLVDTAALVGALDAGTIGGAALDVTDPEPLPAGHPLWGHPRVIITPHVANPPQLQRPALAAHVVENVRRRLRGEDLLAVVDLEAGY